MLLRFVDLHLLLHEPKTPDTSTTSLNWHTVQDHPDKNLMVKAVTRKLFPMATNTKQDEEEASEDGYDAEDEGEEKGTWKKKVYYQDKIGGDLLKTLAYYCVSTPTSPCLKMPYQLQVPSRQLEKKNSKRKAHNNDQMSSKRRKIRTSTSPGPASSSPRYTPASPGYIYDSRGSSTGYNPQSPIFQYTPASPRYNTGSPEYTAASPGYSSQSPRYSPTSPIYIPESPTNGYSSARSGYSSSSPRYTPASPTYSPERSCTYSAVSPGSSINGYTPVSPTPDDCPTWIKNLEVSTLVHNPFKSDGDTTDDENLNNNDRTDAELDAYYLSLFSE